MRRRTAYLTAAMALMTCPCWLTSCFTGIESTPAITGRDVIRHGADNIAMPGDPAADNSRGEPPGSWRAGKQFYVTDSRIGVLFNAPSDRQPLTGDTLTLSSVNEAVTVTGAAVTDLVFTRGGDNHPLTYRLNLSLEELSARQHLDIPYTVELFVVDNARASLNGNSYYIKSSVWCDAGGNPVADGLKMVPVTVTGVEPGSESNPLRVLFTTADGKTASVYMQAGHQAFDRMFATENPRLAYPDISDDTWVNITHGRVAAGMTRQECSLALGAPDDVERGYGYSSVHERWIYSSGHYLIFTDGILTQTNR